MEKEKIKKREVKLIIFLDDNDEKRERYCLILERSLQGVKIQPCDKDTQEISENSAPFEIPNHRILKIKDTGDTYGSP